MSNPAELAEQRITEALWRAYLRERQAFLTELYNTEQDSRPRHGTRQRYQRGCRCALCKRANSRYQLKRRTGDAFKHGVNGYTRHGCRCTICKQARAEYLAEYKRRRRNDEVCSECDQQ